MGRFRSIKIQVFLFTVLCLAVIIGNAQDTLVLRSDTLGVTVEADSVFGLNKTKAHSPRKAIIRSAILPGWGQAYNRKYWKIPLVYAAIGIPTYMFFDNKRWYNETRTAARMIAENDTVGYRSRIDPRLYIFFSTPNSSGALLNYRNEFRKNMDYSILFILLFWGLNVVDATVDAHLKEFDVSDNLSLKIKPTLLQGGQTAGLSFTFTIGKNQPKAIPLR